jgi:hypothetical protein
MVSAHVMEISPNTVLTLTGVIWCCSTNISTGKPAAVLAPATRLVRQARCQNAGECSGKSCPHRIHARRQWWRRPRHTPCGRRKIRRRGRPFGGSGFKSLSVLRTAPSRNWKDDINEPGRLEKDIDLIKRFVPRFGPFSDYQYQISTPMHIIAGVLRLSNESGAPAMRDPRTRSR